MKDYKDNVRLRTAAGQQCWLSVNSWRKEGREDKLMWNFELEGVEGFCFMKQSDTVTLINYQQSHSTTPEPEASKRM